MNTTIIALCGPAGSGKSTVADYLVKKYGAQCYGFAMPIKQMVGRALDFTMEQLYGTQEQKEAIDQRYGHSARWFLQKIGTEGCRATFGEDFWTKQCIDMIVRQNPRLAVIEDMRFCNEAAAVLQQERGFVWRLWPVVDNIALERAASAGTHASEEEWKQLDASLELSPQARGVEHLYKLVDAVMECTPLAAASDGVRW